jgi:hypothetical protein
VTAPKEKESNMTRNEEAPAGTSGEGSKNSSGLATDEYQTTSNPAEIQKNRVRARIDVSDALAAVYAAHAFGGADR